MEKALIDQKNGKPLLSALSRPSGYISPRSPNSLQKENTEVLNKGLRKFTNHQKPMWKDCHLKAFRLVQKDQGSQMNKYLSSTSQSSV